ncbi:MAG: (d)CMP kinase [Clostridia bacterium]|nr:(d)CMP kinase [Clostridia bacterium]
MKIYKIAVDGPAGVGKSSISKAVAKELGITYVDTGAMYRAVGLYCKENNILCENAGTVMDKINIDISYDEEAGQKIYLNGRDVSKDIRLGDVSTYASKVAVVGEVRKKLVEIQQEIGKTKSVIMDGRDIGTKVFPDADVKLFITASAEVRAKRRCAELAEMGETVSYEKILEEIKFRDNNDSTRKIDPLKPAEDAIMVDNSVNTFEKTKEEIIKIINDKIRG